MLPRVRLACTWLWSRVTWARGLPPCRRRWDVVASEAIAAS